MRISIPTVVILTLLFAVGTAQTETPKNLPKVIGACAIFESKIHHNTERDCTVWFQKDDKFYGFLKGNLFSMTITRFDAGGFVMTGTDNTTNQPANFTAKLTDNLLEGTFTVGPTIKGTWSGEFHGAPKTTTGPAWNVYFARFNHVAIINSITHTYKTVDLPKGYASGIAAAPDGSRAYIATDVGPIYVIDGTLGTVAATFSFDNTAMIGFHSIAVSADGSTLYGAGATRAPTEGALGKIDARSGALLKWLAIPKSQKLGATAIANSKIYAYIEGLREFDFSLTKSTPVPGVDQADHLAIASHGKILYTGRYSINTASGEQKVFGGFQDDAPAAATSSGSALYKVPDARPLVMKYDFTDANQGWVVAVSTAPTSIVISPDDSTLFVGCPDGLVYTVDTRNRLVSDAFAVDGSPAVPYVLLAIQPPE